MAVGDKLKIDGVEYEVVWSGGEGLTTITDMKQSTNYTPPRRLYNRTGNHTKEKKIQAQKLAFDELFED